jgi:hypothetical protein
VLEVREVGPQHPAPQEEGQVMFSAAFLREKLLFQPDVNLVVQLADVEGPNPAIQEWVGEVIDVGSEFITMKCQIRNDKTRETYTVEVTIPVGKGRIRSFSRRLITKAALVRP